MRIAIDVSQIIYPGGVSVYTKNLVENLLKIDRENEYVLFFASLRRKMQNAKLKIKNCNAKCKIKEFRFPPTFLDILWNKFHILPIERLIEEIDVFHTSDWIEPPANCPKITTIHDLTALLFPQEVHPKIAAVHKRKLAWVKKESDLIIAVSESTKKDIIRFLGIPEEKIKVIYEAVDERFKPQSQERIDKIKNKYDIEGDYLLCFTGPARKNIERVKKACSGRQIFIVGKPYVSIEDLPSLYSGALCLVYPSLYEGFGLPILEAMACGCPVVTANVSSMPEVAGNAGVLVNPESVEDITKGIKKALENREDFVKKGFKQAEKFSWEKTAQETLKVYKSLVSNH